jgi:peptidoglycan/LPS O-acetylase OafA/YrhL
LRRLNIWLVVVSGLTISIAWRSACYWALKEDPGKIFVMYFYTTQLPGMVDCFAMGFAIARIMSDGELEKFRQWCSNHLWILCALALLGYGAAHYVYTTIPPSWDDWRLWYSLPVLVGHHLLTSSTFAMLVLVSCFLDNSLWLKITAPVRYLGVISYGIYLWHLVVILLLIEVPKLSFDLRLALTIGITIALASASWHLVEKPLSRQFRANAVHSA